MSDLLAIVNPSEDRARAALGTIRHLLELDDACYVTRDDRDGVELHQENL